MATLRELLDDGLQNHRAGRLAEAARQYDAALAEAPEDAEANHLAGILAFQTGRPAEAAERFGRAITADPATAKYRANYGAALVAARRFEAAIPVLEQAAALDPADAGALISLTVVCREVGRIADAVATGRRAVAAAPDDVMAWTALAAALLRAGDGAEMLQAAEAALNLAPNDADALNMRGVALHMLGRGRKAIDALDKAVVAAPQDAEVRCNLALALADAYRLEEAEAQYRAAIAAWPDNAEAHCGLARLMRTQGRPDEALPVYRRAVELAPQQPRLGSGFLFHLLGSPEADGRRLLEAHRDWARRIAAPLAPAAPRYSNSPDPERPVRIGYLSPDLGEHPVGRLLLPVLTAHDPTAVMAVCYSDRRRPDSVTASLQRAAALWRDTGTLGDNELAQTVQTDGIDILVDLAGHSAGNRLRVLARRPAPVQATWLGYPSTTGMDAVGWLIADPVHAPEGCDGDEFVERVIRLPHDLLCFAPPADAPPVGPLPCRAAGYATFGSFNNPGKFSTATFALWARVLAAVPDSRLLLRYRTLEAESVRVRLQARFAAAGIDPGRIAFAGRAPYREVLESYNRVDIALDTAPYSGTMTTLEALWMGVPVVALAGDRMAARQSAAHLAAAGLGELVASDSDGYVDLAVRLAADPARLADLRAGMRALLAASPLCDIAGFTRALEAAYRAMWRDWCTANA